MELSEPLTNFVGLILLHLVHLGVVPPGPHFLHPGIIFLKTKQKLEDFGELWYWVTCNNKSTRYTG